MASDVGVKLGVDGEKAFRSSISAVNAQIKALGAEMTAVTATFSKNADSQQALAAKNEVLGRSIEATKSKTEVLSKQIADQKSKLDALGEALERAAKEFGENSKEALQAQNEYNKQSKKVSDLTAQLHRAEAELANMDQAVEDNKEAMSGWGDGWQKAGDKLKAGMAAAAAAATAAITAASAAAAALAKESLGAFASYEQLTGGVETLFKESSGTVMEYADNAFRTAGLSANEYMETVTGFSASLLQSLGGDTEKAAHVADQAMTDMADNANKMGTAMDSIQNAYQGFAKQNYTMLDNLKLGYGGTKEEMQRLLADAEALSGVKYDISSFADITEAIHVVQTEMGITGTTALEAATTIEGSTNAMKSAWTNLVTGIAREDGDLSGLMSNFAESVETAGKNVIPRVQIILENMGALIEQMVPEMAAQIPSLLQQVLPPLVEAGGKLLAGLASGIAQAAPQLLEQAQTALTGLISVITAELPNIASTAEEIITTLASGMAEAIPELLPVAIDAVLQIVETIIDNADMLLDSALEIIVALADGLVNSLPTLIEKAPVIVSDLVDSIVDNAPKLLTAAAEIIGKLATGIIDNLPEIGKAAAEIVGKVVSGTVELMNDIIGVGKNIVSGVWDGITEKAKWLENKVKGFFNGIVTTVQDLLGIDSPSKVFRDEVGQYISLGVAEGIDDTRDKAVKAAATLAEDVYTRSKEWADRQAKYQKASLSEQLTTWRTIQDQFIKESKQYAQAEEKILDLRAQMQEEFSNKVEDANKKITDLQNDYYDAMEKRQNEIASAYGLFDKVAEREEISGKDLLQNLRDQVSVMRAFYKGLDELSSRGVGDAIVEEIRAMGPSAEDELHALLGLTDRELDQYANIYMEKQQLANRVALDELRGLKKQTDEEISSQIDDLRAYYSQNAPELGETFAEGLAAGMLGDISLIRRAGQDIAAAAMEPFQNLANFQYTNPVSDISETMTRSGGAPSGYEAAQRAMEMAAEKFARRSEPITLGELQQAFAGAVSGMEVSMDGQKVGRIVTTRQEYDDRSYSR